MSQYLSDKVGGVGEGYMALHPGSLPACLVADNFTYLKHNQTAGYLSGVEDFFIAGVALIGAVAQVISADMWTPVCTMTGGGYLGWALSTGHSSTHTPELRITADGITRTITATDTAGAHRCTFGLPLAGYPATGISSEPLNIVNGYRDYGFQARSGGELFRRFYRALFLTTPQMLALGMPVLRFEHSLVVEAKTNIAGLSGALAYAAVAYSLDWEG